MIVYRTIGPLVFLCGGLIIFKVLCVSIFQEEPLHGFKVAKNLKYMKELEDKYRKMVLPDMMNITKP